jgi:hypothetical protein
MHDRRKVQLAQRLMLFTTWLHVQDIGAGSWLVLREAVSSAGQQACVDTNGAGVHSAETRSGWA